MWRATRIEVRSHHRLFVEFTDGVCGEVDLSGTLRGPMAASLKDESFFRLAFIDEFGVVAWPNGFDLAPEVLYERVACSSKGDLADASR